MPLTLTAAAQKLLRTKGKLVLKLRVGFTPKGKKGHGSQAFVRVRFR